MREPFSVSTPPGKKDGKENEEEGVEDPRAVGLVQARDHLSGQDVAHLTNNRGTWC